MRVAKGLVRWGVTTNEEITWFVQPLRVIEKPEDEIHVHIAYLLTTQTDVGTHMSCERKPK
jgi:hypothetical protein